MNADQVFSAYETVMSATSTQAARSQASRFLEEVKTQPKVCRDCAIELLKRQNTHARHLAALLFESLVKLHWGILTGPQKGQVRNDVLNILATAVPNDPHYVREKMACLVNEIAKKDWPQDWPEYFDALVKISGFGDAQREMVLLAIRRLVEDVTHFSDDLGKKRCDQLMSELKSKSKQMILFLTQGLTFQGKVYRDSNGQNIPAGRLAVALMDTLSCFFSWVNPSVVFDCEVPELLVSFFGDAHALRMSAAEALLHLLEQEHGKISVAGKFFFPIERPLMFKRALELRVGNPQECVLFQQTLGRILVAVGKKHLLLVEKHNFPVPPTYSEFLSVMGMFLEHKDLVFCETTLPFFNQLLRTEPFKASPAFDQVAPTMTASFVKKLMYGISPDSLKTIREDYFSDDNDDVEDAPSKERMETFLTRFSSLLKDVLRKIALARPLVVLSIAGAECQKFMAKIKTVAPAQVTSKKSREYLAFQGCVDVMDGVVRNGILPDDAQHQANSDKLLEGMRQLLLMLYEYESDNPLLMGLKIRGLRSFTPFYKKNPKILSSVLQKLLGMVLFRGPNEDKKSHGELSKLTLRVRKEACDSFLRLCVELPDVLVSQIGAMADHVVEKLIKGDTSFGEKAVLRDALVAISTAMPDPAFQARFIKVVLDPVVAVWTSEGMTANVGDGHKLLAWVGAAPNMSPKWENGNVMVSMLETFRTTIKRAPQASKELLPIILPNVFLLCRTIHRIWKPGHDVHAFVKAKLGVVFAPDQGLYASMLGKKIEQNFALYVASWLQNLREATYKVIGVSSKLPQFYSIPNLPNIMNNFVFAELSDAAIQHITLLIHHVIENLLLFAPPESYNSFLAPILPRLFSFLLNRLYKCWGLENTIKKGEGSMNADDEIVQTKLSMDFARSWSRALLHVLHVERNPNQGKDGAQTLTSPLCQFVLRTPDVLLGLLATLSGALSDTCDNNTMSHILELLERLIGMLLNNHNLHEALGGQLLHSLLRATSKRANNEHSSRFLRLAAEIYIRLRDSSRTPFNVMRSTGVSEQAIGQMEVRFRSENGVSKKTPKNRAAAMSETLGDWVGGDITGVGEGMNNSLAQLLFQKFPP